MWRQAADLGLPRMVFINKLDRERASFERHPGRAPDAFGAGVAPLELPIGEEAAFCGVADLLSDTAIHLRAGRGRPPGSAARHHGEIPDDMEALEHQVHDNLVEGIVVADDDLMERYLDGDVPSLEQLEKTLALGVAAARVFPVVCGSATARVGIDRLADFICEIGPVAPRPTRRWRSRRATTSSRSIPTRAARRWPGCSRPSPIPHVGQISLLKVLSGTVHSPTTTWSTPGLDADERLHGLFALRGKEHLDQGRGRRRRHRGRGQAVGHRHRRHAGPQGHPGAGAAP